MATRNACFLRPTLLTLSLLALAGFLAWFVGKNVLSPQGARFDGERAMQDVLYQTSLGPRTPGSAAHAQVVEWLQVELQAAGWQVNFQEAAALGHPIQNIIARRSNAPPQILLAAHYDSRMIADRDPDPARRAAPVPGANDGASGVAVLLELARTLPLDTVPLWLVFFDAEDNGGIPGWDWLLGSRAFVSALTEKPQAVVIIDMIGDADLNIYLEMNSNPRLAAEVWEQAAALGYDEVFIPTQKYRILDDHIPFIEAGIPAVDIIDFDYPYWHTTADTADKVSAQSLQIVGETLWAWVLEQE